MRANLPLPLTPFTPKGKGFRCGDVTFSTQPGWFLFEAPYDDAVSLLDNLGKPGLWKPAVPPKPKRPRRELHLPLPVLAAGESA